MKNTAVLLLGALLALSACRSTDSRRPSSAGPERALDWTLGDWEGTRRDVGDGSEEPLRMRVRAILGGREGVGQTHEITIEHAGGVYRGFAAQVHDPALGCWVRQYVNDVRRTFARLEGVVEDDACVFRSVTPGRTRGSRVVERLEGGTWRRTMSVSEDGGASWRELWIDELRLETATGR